MSADQPGGIDAETVAVFEAVPAGEPLTTQEIATALGLGRRGAYKRLNRLADTGSVETKKVGSGGRVWWLPPEGTGRLADAADVPLYGLDGSGRITDINPAAAELLGGEPDELIGEELTAGQDREAVDAIEEALARVGETGTATVEYDLTTRDGQQVPVEARLTGDRVGTVGVWRDISDRRANEGELERTTDLLRHTERIANVGGWELDIGSEANEAIWTEQLFDIFEIDHRDSLRPEEVLSHVHPADRDRVRAETDRLLSEGEGLVQEYRIRTGEGRDRWVRVVSERPDDRQEVLRGATMDITELKASERELERRRAGLSALNDLNEVVRGVTEAVIDQSSREAIERATCEGLMRADSYLFAWIAEVNPRTREIVPRVEVGTEGYLDEVELSIDPSKPTGRGPAGRAFRTGEIHVATDARRDSQFEPWHDVAEAYGYRSAAAIPIVHDGTVFGLIGIYADRVDAFNEAERAIVGQVGEVVGHAIAGLERKRALQREDVTEISFNVRNFFGQLGVEATQDAPIQFQRTVRTGEDQFLAYGTTVPENRPLLAELVDSEAATHWTELTVLDRTDDRIRFEARLVDPPVLSAVDDAGGYAEDAVITDDSLQLTVHLLSETDVHTLVDRVREMYPNVELLTRKQTERTVAPPGPLPERLSERLTERQAAALEAGYSRGFFEWPRHSSGEDVASALDISPSTFHQHVRKAEKELLDLVFAE